jgi:hypothetical protein
MVKMAKNSTSTAVSHTNAVKDIVQAGRNAYEAILKLQSVNDINADGVFVESTRGSEPHPQKAAHAYLLGYHYQLAKKSYWINAKDYWQDPVTDDAGNPYLAVVPDGTDFEITKESPDDSITLDDISTKTEKLRLETVGHRWSFRTVTFRYNASSPYRESDEMHAEQKRVWLPPRGLQLLFEQLENVRSKIGLAADVEEPGWRSDEPV